ncbi:15878_t:CDS:2 [Entrophospora sp. SA101]|nr:15878_t:CDS:2 [Entrophospora sp. SA101]
MPRGKKKPTRKNVTTACLECKKSKTKCTGNTPCGNCTKRVMNRCKACKNNIKDTDISKLEACGKCKTQASKSCEFPQEKPRRGPPPRQTNQKAINYTPFDIKDKNIFGEGMLFDYTKGSMNIEEYNSVNDDSLFSEFIIFEEPISDTPFDIKDKNIFGEGMLFDYTKGSMNIEEYNSVNDDSLFSEFIIFEEPISASATGSGLASRLWW